MKINFENICIDNLLIYYDTLLKYLLCCGLELNKHDFIHSENNDENIFFISIPKESPLYHLPEENRFRVSNTKEVAEKFKEIVYILDYIMILMMIKQQYKITGEVNNNIMEAIVNTSNNIFNNLDNKTHTSVFYREYDSFNYENLTYDQLSERLTKFMTKFNDYNID